MTTVEIEYCVPCGFLETAMQTQRHLLEEFGRDLTGVELQPGHGGVFEVRVGEETIWDKDVHGGDVDHELVADAVGETLAVDD
ncbi:Rdx family protein [Haloarculaceae archaeon H-GB2-1]|nr:Rdx family protein [Haloarculaceae archaeon H-GB1-1]MEA5386141.1 Rdx family protein [Haloarculaceae archaeon H-GB11]MEA5407647.1 Rdx family protein [Haloarculaceae archaeon H-GB2-1]